MALDEYRKKRDFEETPEPAGDVAPPPTPTHRYAIQEHHATRLHYDLRLEMEGVLKSWAIPKGPSMNPADKRLAVMTEDHPLMYLTWEGHIPKGNYGAGDMVVWDTGEYGLFEGDDPVTELGKGMLKIVFHGRKLQGKFALIKTKQDARSWLLIKERDEYADPDWKLVQDLAGFSRKDREELLREEQRAETETDPFVWSKELGRDVPAELSTLAAAVPGAVQRDMPRDFEPMLANTADEPFSDPEWIFELKWDGFRAFVEIKDGKARLFSRRGNDLSSRYPGFADLPRRIHAKEALLDTELVALDAQGISRFQLLQPTAFGPGDVDRPAVVALMVFDVLHCDGYDLRGCKLIDRKAFVKTLADWDNTLRYSDHVAAEGIALFEQAKTVPLEGILAKRAASPYVHKRTDLWLKIKIQLTADVAVVGYTEPKGTREHFGALIGAINDNGVWRYTGNIGGISSSAMLAELYAAMTPRRVEKSPFQEMPRRFDGKPHWIDPPLVAQVRHGGWTHDRMLRFPVFQGLRDDKLPEECVYDAPEDAGDARRAAEQEEKTLAGEVSEADEKGNNGGREDHAMAAQTATAGRKTHAAKDDETLSVEEALYDPKAPVDARVRVGEHVVAVTNLNKVYWPADGYTKRDLIAYYARIAETILPHLVDRPLILKRYPNGIAALAFYQHNLENPPAFVRSYARDEDGKEVRYAVCDNAAGLLYLANLGTIAVNPWHSRVSNIENPDYVCFDLDPDDVAWDDVCDLALVLRDVLLRAGLNSYAKTSGASGIHIYLPIRPVYPYSQGLSFANVIAALAQAERPKLVTLERFLKNRPKNRIYLDCYQNVEGKTLAGPYSVREQPGASVSAPLTWDEVEKRAKILDFTLKNVPDRVEKLGDLFQPLVGNRQSLSEAIETLHGSMSKKD